MKKLLLATLTILTIGGMGGCAILDYAKERKATVCSGITTGECPAGFKEVDAGIIPSAGSTISPVADLLLTCVSYSSEDKVCPDGTRKFVIDVIK